MPTKCYVEWCFTGYPSQSRENKRKNMKNSSMFRAPKDPVLRKKWNEAVGRSNRELSSTDSICELHFSESDIERYFETVMPDGSIDRIPRKVRLKRGAVPSTQPLREPPEEIEEKKMFIASNRSNTENVVTRESGEETEGKVQTVQNHVKTESTIEKNTVSEANPDDDTMWRRCNKTLRVVQMHKNVYGLEDLKEDLGKFSLPEKWAYAFVDEKVHFLHWNLRRCAAMTVEINRDMTVKVRVCSEKIAMAMCKVTSFDTVLQHLMTLDKRTFCEGNGTNGRRAESCSIFICETDASIIRTRCLPCCTLRRTELSMQQRRKAADIRRKLENQRLRTAIKRKNVRLETKVHKLQAVINNAKKGNAAINEETLEAELN